MEMPEGWKKLYVRGRIIEGHDCDDIEVVKALDLIKEMAEALEYYEKESWKLTAENNPANQVLKKFRSWE